MLKHVHTYSNIQKACVKCNSIENILTCCVLYILNKLAYPTAFYAGLNEP